MSIKNTFRENNTNEFAHKIQVTGVFSHEGQLELKGTSQALKELGETILNNTKYSTKFAIEVPSDVSAKPYDGFLTDIELTVLEQGNMLEIKHDQTKLTISGSPENHGIFAETVLWVAKSANRGSHTHVEYWPEHYYLAPTSEALVVSLDYRE